MNNCVFWYLNQVKQTLLINNDTFEILVKEYYIAYLLILAGVDKLHENQLLHVFMKNIL